MKDLEEKLERLEKARKEKPIEIIFNQKYLRENRGVNIKFWVHEINVLHGDEYKKHFPESEPFKLKEFEDIAVVGNSGSLSDTGKGEEIDDHDKILRFNTAPVSAFSEDVGSRTDFRFSIGSLTYRSGNEKMIRSYRRNAQAIRDKDSVLDEPWHYIHTHEFADWVQSFKENNEGNDVCSTGFLGVFFSSLLSERVDLYGFALPTEGTDFDYHYYDNVDYVERSHQFKEEHRFYEYLDQNTKWFNWKEV